jgi:hypothetical protein
LFCSVMIYVIGYLANILNLGDLGQYLSFFLPGALDGCR